MTDATNPDPDALVKALDVPTPDEWREAVRVFTRSVVVFVRVAPALAPELEAMGVALIAMREPVAAVLAVQQLPPPKELPGG